MAAVVLRLQPQWLDLETRGEALPQSYVGLLVSDAGQATLLASSRRHGRTITVKLLQPIDVPTGQVARLWALPRDGSPFLVGEVPAKGSATLRPARQRREALLQRGAPGPDHRARRRRRARARRPVRRQRALREAVVMRDLRASWFVAGRCVRRHRRFVRGLRPTTGTVRHRSDNPKPSKQEASMKLPLVRFVFAAALALALQHTGFAADTPTPPPHPTSCRRRAASSRTRSGPKRSTSSSASTTRPARTGTT